jgi:hypothetical protein
VDPVCPGDPFFLRYHRGRLETGAAGVRGGISFWLSFLPPTFGFSAPTELALSRLNCFTIHRLVLYRLPLHYQSLIGWQPLPPLNFMKYAFSRPHPRSDVV